MKSNDNNSEVFKALTNSFTALYMVDLETGDYQNYVARESIADLTSQFAKFPNFEDLVRYFNTSGMVHPDDVKAMMAFYPNNAGMRESLMGKKRRSIIFRRKYHGEYLWTKVTIVKKGGPDESPRKVAIAFNECDDEVRSEQALKTPLTILQKNLSPGQAIDELLSHTGSFYGADRAYIFEYDRTRGTVDNTYEWCREGVEPMIEKLKGVPFGQVAGWFEEFRRKGAFYMDALDSAHNTEETRRTLEMQGIWWLVAAPILQNGETVGFIGVDNPTCSKHEIRLLQAVATVAYAEILKRREDDEQHVTLGKLSEAFLSVYYVDLSRDYIRNWKIADEYRDAYAGVTSYAESFVGYMKTGILEADRERCVAASAPESIRAAFASADRFSIETTDVTLGSERGIVFDFIKVSDDGNQFVVCCRDISETLRRQKAHRAALVAALKESETLNRRNLALQQIIKAGPWSFRFNAAREVTETIISPECNEVVRNVVGDGNAWMELVHPEDRARVTSAWAAALQDRTGATLYDVEYRIRSAEGDYGWIRSAGRALTNSDGTGEFYGVCVDVTDVVAKREAEKTRLEDALAALRVESEKNRVFSDVTRQLYGFDLSVDLTDGGFTLIPGSGADEAVAVMAAAPSFRALYDAMLARVKPEYHARIRELVSFDYLRMNRDRGEVPGSVVYETTGSRWGEVTVMYGTNAEGHPIANILGRDVTDSRQEAARLEREQRAAAAKDQILSGITLTLFGFNVTVNLARNTFTCIKGSGTEGICEILESFKDRPYTDVADVFLSRVPEEFRQAAYGIASRDFLMDHRDQRGHFGTETLPWADGNGRKRWVEINGFMAENADGEPVVNLLGRDITEQHDAQIIHEREVKAAAAKDQVMANITKAIYAYNLTVNLDTLAISVIRGTGADCTVDVFEKLKSYDEILKANPSNVDTSYTEGMLALISPEAMRAKFDAGIRGFAGRFDYPTYCEIHGHHWRRINLFLGTDENDAPTANLLCRDITEARERKLREKREHEAAVAKDRIMAEITKELYGYNLTINLNTMKFKVILGTGMDKASEIFNNTDDFNEAYRTKVPYIVPADRDKIAALLSPEALKRAAAEGRSGPLGTMTYEADIDGEHQWHETNVFIGTDFDGNPIANVLGRNVTKQFREQDAEAKLKVAEASNRAKSEFLFNMSHDIRTPMHAIMGFVDIAQEELRKAGSGGGKTESAGVLEDSLEKIRKSGDLLFSLINSVLDVSRLESGKVELVESAGDILESFEGVRSTMIEMAKKKNINLVFDFGAVRDRYVYADFEKANRIFMNILTNSIKYTNEGGKVRVRCRQVDRARYRYVFSDNGIGMAPEFVEKLYDRFSREKNTTMSGIAGIGLGMSICKSFVDLMGGTIRCRSRLGTGTTFIVDLPFRVREEDSRGARTSSSAEKGEGSRSAGTDSNVRTPGFSDRRVLLVDDSKLNREVTKFYLLKAGFKVETAENGQEAVEKVKNSAYDLVLMDIQMPVMDGYEATRAIRAFEMEKRGGGGQRKVPIIALSANAFEEDRAKALEAGMDDHLAKGVKADEIIARIARHLGGGDER